ncbi:MAG: hypothetical protein U0O23_00010 [Mediterraneibacter gnavus]
MGKVDDYTAGRSQGLILAREIVKKDGIDGLEKEIQFRNITGINTALTRKELNIACEKIKNMTLDTMMVLFGKLNAAFSVRLKRVFRST